MFLNLHACSCRGASKLIQMETRVSIFLSRDLVNKQKCIQTETKMLRFGGMFLRLLFLAWKRAPSLSPSHVCSSD